MALLYFFSYGAKAGYQIADYEWYARSFCNFTPEIFNFLKEGFCRDFLSENIYINDLYNLWKSPPIYTYIFLAPYFVIRSNLFLVFEGYLIGIFIFIFLRKAAIKFNICKYENAFLVDITLCLFSLNIYFIKDVLSVSSNSVLLFWICLCLCVNFKNKFLNTLLWSLSFLVRPAAIFVIAAFYLSIFLKRNKHLYKYFKYLPLFIFVYLISYFIYIKSWPLPIWKQAIFPYVQGLPTEIRDQKSLALLSKILGREINFQSEFSYLEIFKIFFSKLPFTFFINWLQKLQASLGDGFLLNYFTDTKLHIAYFISNLYYWLILKPSFYLCIFLSIFNNQFKATILASVIFYLLITSIFAGDPRYSILVSPIMTFTLIDFLYKKSIKVNLRN